MTADVTTITAELCSVSIQTCNITDVLIFDLIG